MTETLLQRVASNDPAAFQAVMDQYGGLVWSLARRFSFGSAEAEDAVQEVFLELWRSANRFNPAVASEATFIAMIARRRLIDRLRRSSRRSEPRPIEEASVPAAQTASRVEVSDEAARAAEALSTLSAEQQRVLRLSICQGLSHEEIAGATGLPLGTVKTHCRRGLIRIREILEDRKGARPQSTGRAM